MTALWKGEIISPFPRGLHSWELLAGKTNIDDRYKIKSHKVPFYQNHVRHYSIICNLFVVH